MNLLLNYVTSWKVAGSIPDGITGFFSWPNPSSRTMALGSTQPLRRSAYWRDRIRYATWHDVYPETEHLSEQQSRSHWSDTIHYTISDTTEGRDLFFGSVVIMSSWIENDVLAYMYLQRRRQKKRRCWVHQYNVRKIKHSSAVVSRELSQHEEKFHEFYRMSPDSFRFLEKVVSAQLQNKDTNFRFAISLTEKLLITMR
jgi:hypothetical protein